MDDSCRTTIERSENALANLQKRHYVLKLFVAGNSSLSASAIQNIRRICDTHIQGNYDLEVVDIFQQPDLARSEQIVAVPTVIKILPLPLKRLVGDLSEGDRLLVGLDLVPR